MFSALLFSQNPAASEAIELLACDAQLLKIQKSLTRFPNHYELSVLLNTHSPDLVFMELSELKTATSMVSLIHSINPQIGIVGFGAGWGNQTASLNELTGISEILTSPVTPKEFQSAVYRAIHSLGTGAQENLLAFLPAKAGSGCTTVALNTSGCLAALGRKVLIIEADLNSGVLPILVDAKAAGSLLDALENSSHLDYSMWSACVVQKLGVDLLMAGRSKPFPSWNNYHHLLEYVKPRYDNIVVDLPEVANDATEEILRRARFAFIVCTPELPSLKLAQRRCREIESRGVPADRIGIIVNRWHASDIQERDIEQTLDHAVAAIFPNDYASVQEATANSRLVDRGTDLGKTFLSLARLVAGLPEDGAGVPPKSVLRFLKSLAVRKRA